MCQIRINHKIKNILELVQQSKLTNCYLHWLPKKEEILSKTSINSLAFKTKSNILHSILKERYNLPYVIVYSNFSIQVNYYNYCKTAFYMY